MSNDVGIRVGIEGEKQFRDSLKGINSQLKNLNTELDASAQKFKNSANSEEALEEKTDILSRTIDAQKKKIELLTTQYDNQIKKLSVLGDELDKVSEEFGKSSDQAAKAQTAYNRQATQVNNLGSQLNTAKSDLSRFEEQMRTASDRSIRFSEDLKSAALKLDSFSSKASSVGNFLTLGVTAPILGAGAAAVKIGNDFEAQMSRVKAISRATNDEISSLEDLALELGQSTSFSASEVAQGMENLASAGFSVDEIMSALPGMLDLAASSGIDLATASDIASSSLRGFSLSSADAEHVADIFAETAAQTNARIEDIGESMKYIAPVANAMGQNIEEVTAAIGIMADAGIKGEQAGTSLRGALSRLAKPTDVMRQTMDDLGISFYNSSGEMLPLNEIIERLQKSFEGLTQEQQNNALVTLFGQESLSGMLALIDRGPEELRNLTKSLENADGAASDMAETMLDNTSGSIEEMNGAIETAAITLQKSLAPHIKNVANFVTDLAERFSELDDGTQNLIISIAGIAAAAGPATKLLGGITGAAGKVAGGIGGLISKIKDLDNAQKNAKTSTSNLSSVISGLANPTTGAITLAVGAFGIYMYWLGEMMFKENEYIEQSKEKNKQLDNQIEKLKQISKESEIAVSQIKSESDYYQTLYDEMQLLVDANGNIKSGYEDRVEYILGELSQAYGVESELVNGVITDYENLKQSIENASTSSMAQKLLEEYDDDYSEAIKTISETEKSMNDYLMEAEKLQQEYNEYLAENTDSLGRFWGDKEQLHELGQNAEYARQQYEEYAKTYQDQQAIIDRVDSARMAAMNGNYQEAVNILDNTVDKREQASKSLYQIGLEELTTERERNKQLLEEYERTGSESVKISLDASNERIAILEQSLVDSLDTVKENEVPYMTILSELANAGTKGYTSNLNFKTPTIEQIELLKQAIESEDPYVSAAAQNVAKNATNALSSEDENMQRAGAELIEYFANGISSEDEETREKTAAISGVISSTLDIAPELFNIGKNNGESYMEGFESAVNTIGNTVASILSSNPNSWSRQSYSPAAYSAPQMAPASASLMSVSENAPALFSNELSEETAPLISMVKSRVAFLDISDDMYDAGVKMANSIERGIRANIMPERQEISVVMPSGSTGTTLNQTNNFYSPEALSPAETARLNRVNVRRTIQALR